VAQYLGLREIAQGEAQGDYMLLEYAQGAKLYVPLARMDLVQRFRGAGEAQPALDRMGGATWTRTKTRIKSRMPRYGGRVVEVVCRAQDAEGFQFSPDSNWQRSSRRLRVLRDRRATKPRRFKRLSAIWRVRSRWIGCFCGDVGYGKTEVAMRAAFKRWGMGSKWRCWLLQLS